MVEKGASGGVSGFFRRFWHTLVFYSVGFKWNLRELFTPHRKFDLKKVPRRPGEVGVITGGARGIGLQVVKKLLVLDMHVVIGCRNKEAGLQAVENLRKNGLTTGSTNVLALDLNSLESVREFAAAVCLKYPKIHLLINNGGIMAVPYARTVDGYESQFQTNYLSHFLLTMLLLPKLIRAGRAGKSSRIVNVSSAAHFGGSLDFSDINWEKMYSKNMAYMSSKLAQVVSTRDLNSRLEKEGAHVRVYAVHPGVVSTELYTKVCLIRTCMFAARLIFKTPEQGADCILYSAISTKFEGEGGYFFANSSKTSPNSLAKKAKVQQQLWDLSISLTKWKEVPISDMVNEAMAAGRKITPKPIFQEEPMPKSRKISEKRAKLSRQEQVEVVQEHSVTTPEIQRNSVDSTASSSTISSTATVIGGNDYISISVIPATATEISSSSSDEDTRSVAQVSIVQEQYDEKDKSVTVTSVSVVVEEVSRFHVENEISISIQSTSPPPEIIVTSFDLDDGQNSSSSLTIEELPDDHSCDEEHTPAVIVDSA